MSADHRRPLFAFLVVASICALLIGQGIRTNGFLDFIIGQSATPAAAPVEVARQVTLEPQPERSVAPAPGSGDVEPTGSSSPDGNAAEGGKVGSDAPSPQPPKHAQGGGKPSHADDGRSQGARSHGGRGQGGHGAHARADDDGPGKGDDGKGQGMGRGKNHDGRPGKAKGKGKGPAHDNVPAHVQGPRP